MDGNTFSIRYFQGKFSTKSDVWSFGVTLWEILTFGREQPFESLTDEKVIANLSSLYQNDRPMTILPAPHACAREVWDLMKECWNRQEKERPSFTEIHLFLQRKNLGFSPPQGQPGSGPTHLDDTDLETDLDLADNTDLDLESESNFESNDELQ